MYGGVSPLRRFLPVAVIVAVAIAFDRSGAAAVATLLLVGNVGRRRDLAGLAAWIVGGALVGGAVGYGAHGAVRLPLSMAGAVGMGVALGGGLGGISHFLSTGDPATANDERMTVDMASDATAEPRPADLFDEHPDPVLYVTDAGAGPVVRAANAAYERTFDLPATTIEDAPLAEVLRVQDDPTAVVDPIADGGSLDETLAFETAAGTRRFRVRTIAAPDDGYLLFTPVDH